MKRLIFILLFICLCQIFLREVRGDGTVAGTVLLQAIIDAGIVPEED